jgi:hypothetical protein
MGAELNVIETVLRREITMFYFTLFTYIWANTSDKRQKNYFGTEKYMDASKFPFQALLCSLYYLLLY